MSSAVLIEDGVYRSRTTPESRRSLGEASAIGYSGNWTDPDTGLVYLRARDYDPRTAQFTTVDPAVDSTRQPYAYVANDPLLLTDPTGLDFWGDAGRNALAFGAGVLDGATFGVSSAILGAVVPGYNCLIKDNAFFTVGDIAGTIVSSVAITALTAGAGGALVATGIGLRIAAREALSIAASAARRVVVSGFEKVGIRFGEKAAAEEVPTVVFSRSAGPGIAGTFDEAVAGGAPTRLNRVTAAVRDDNRVAALRDQPPAPAGQSLDEYPFASSAQGGAGATVRPVPIAEQNYQGGVLSSFYRTFGIRPGDPFNVIFGP